MEIKKEQNGDELTIYLDGRLDTTTSPKLEQELKDTLDDNTKKLVIDLENLEYMSSAGLRVLLQAQKRMNKQGEMVVRNVNDTIKDIFEVTGFSDILTVE